jgi:exodeoxyribonuclease VII large subunit
VVVPTLVQGKTAGAEIARAIQECNEWGEADVIIVGRGGGSLEDLWAFNEEPVARAIFASRIPVVSAVGHEVDFTISDFVADLRAPTPTAAAEFVVPDYRDYQRQLAGMVESIIVRVQHQTERYREMIHGFGGRYGIRRVRDLYEQQSQRVDELTQNLAKASRQVTERKRQQLQQLQRTLVAVSPQATLNRGYSITRSLQDGSIIRDIEQVAAGMTLETVVARGRIISDVTDTTGDTPPQSE